MALSFPNPSRSYDVTLRRIHFSGYDGVFEVSFCIEIDAFFSNASRSGVVEQQYLQAFDKARRKIQDAARLAYSKSREPLYVLTAADF